MHMVFEGELAVERHDKVVEVGTSSDRNQTRPCKSPWGGLPVLVLLTTKAIALLGFSIYHAPVILPLQNPSQVPVKGGTLIAHYF